MQYKPEFDSREDVFRCVISFNYGAGYDRYQEMIYFVPTGKGEYEFCTRNKTPNEQKIQQWMNNVKNKSVILGGIPYVIANAKFKGLGETVDGLEFYNYMEQTKWFAERNGLNFHLKRGHRDAIQVIGMAVEHSIETYSDLAYCYERPECEKYEARKYHLFVRDIINKNKYVITLNTSKGVYSSEGVLGSKGNIKVEPWTEHHTFTHTPKEPMFIRGFAINPETLSIRQEFIPEMRELYTVDYCDGGKVFNNNVFCCDSGKSDCPNGSVNVDMKLFKPTVYAMDKRPVWIIKGKSGTGIHTLVGHLEDMTVFETDSVDKLPKTIYDDVVVLSNRSHFTVEDIKNRLFGDPNVMIVSFDRDDHMLQRENYVRSDRRFKPRSDNDGR